MQSEGAWFCYLFAADAGVAMSQQPMRSNTTLVYPQTSVSLPCSAGLKYCGVHVYTYRYGSCPKWEDANIDPEYYDPS